MGALLLLAGVAAAASAAPGPAGLAAPLAPMGGVAPAAGYAAGPDQGTNYSVNFTESGLPANTTWSVTLGTSTLTSSTSSIAFSEPNGSYGYTVGAVAGYNASPALGTIFVSGASPTPTAISFTLANATTPYVVTFGETGLPAGTNWSVTFGGSTLGSNGSSIAFNATNGTYAWSAGTVVGYVPTPAEGNLTVNGLPVWENLTFVPSSTATYPVVFSETGLPNATLWSVTLAGATLYSNSTNVTFQAMNGTYAWSVGGVSGYAPNVAGGNLTVAGQEVNQSVVFLPSTTAYYAVTFTETGLTSGTSWSVALNGTNQSSTNGTIQFSMPNGTYSWTVGAVAGYLPSNASGLVSVVGLPTWVNLTFAPTSAGSYTVTFSETGLRAGTNWSVAVEGIPYSSTSSTILLTEPNGTYAFSVVPISGYNATPASGTVSVTGASVSQPIAFSPSNATPPPSGGSGGGKFLGLPADEGYAVLGGVILVILILIGAAIALARRRGRGGSSEPDGPTQQGGTSAGAQQRSG